MTLTSDGVPTGCHKPGRSHDHLSGAFRRFGSLTTVSSQYNDSSGSGSPQEQRRREAAATISNADPGRRSRSYGGDGSDSDKRPRGPAAGTTVLVGDHPSHSGNHSGSSNSSSRSIATNIGRLPDHLSVRRRPQQQRRSSTDGEETPAAGTGDLTSTLLPQTPEWLRDGNLSVSESGLETPHRVDEPLQDPASPRGSAALSGPESAAYWEPASDARHAHKPQQQQANGHTRQALENGGSWCGRQKHFVRNPVADHGAAAGPPRLQRTSSDATSSTATLSGSAGGGRVSSGASASGSSPPAVGGRSARGSSPELRVLGSLPTAIPGNAAPRNHAVKQPAAATVGVANPATDAVQPPADEDLERNAAWR